MANIPQDHFYSVDPGIGKKDRTCPYSLYEDGRDVVQFIYPPRGYEFVGFKFVSYGSNSFYDGRIVAQYEKVSLSTRIKKKPMPYLLSLLGIIVVLGGLIYFLVNSRPTPKKPPKQQAKTEVKAASVDTTVQEQVTDTCMIAEVASNEETEKEEIIQEEVKTVEPKEEEVAVKPEPKPEPVQATQPTAELTKEQFHQEFWGLIYRKETRMDTYMNLYNKYKSLQLRSNEFYYLYLTILENTSAFNSWKAKLLLIPNDELKAINTINELKQKIEEY